MIYCFNNVEIFYDFQKVDDGVVNVFLHGWGRSHKDFDEIINVLGIKNFLKIDFPPFGKSAEPIDWTIFTYVNMILSLLDHLNLKKINIISHSFGGRIAIIISAIERKLVNKLMLIDSAGMKPKHRLKYKFKVFIFKLKRKLGLNVLKYGSNDYKSLSQNMKKIFVNVTQTFLEDYAKLIDAKTLVIFGEKDKDTPVYMAKRLKKLIKNSELKIISNAGHFCFFERKIIFFEVLNKFLKED